jgi:Zn-dependent alcohol dehydrogenase
MGGVLDTDVTLNVAGLTLLQKNLQGSIFGHGNPEHDIPMPLSLYQAGRLNLDDMVTREYTLEQIKRRLPGHARGPQYSRHHPLHRRRPLSNRSGKRVETHAER